MKGGQGYWTEREYSRCFSLLAISLNNASNTASYIYTTPTVEPKRPTLYVNSYLPTIAGYEAIQDQRQEVLYFLAPFLPLHNEFL